MSKNKPTPEEVDAILQYQYGAYDVNLPDWYTTPSDYKPQVIPEAAVEAAAKAAYEVAPVELFGDDQPVTWEQLSDSRLGQVRKDHELRRARRGLEAATPHLISHEREEARLAHLDAVANAETADRLETKLAAIIVALDPFERVTDWTATRDEAGCPAFDAVLKIRSILGSQ